MANSNPDNVDNKLSSLRHPVHYTQTLPATYTISVIGAFNAELFTYPLDLVKTRLQVQGEAAQKGQKVPYRGMIATTFGIVREEGFFKLWKGMTPALYRHTIYSGSRIVIYDKLRQQFNGHLNLWQASLCGAVAGGVAQWVANPTDIIKVQAQTDGKRVMLGLEPRYHSFGKTLKDIYHRGGIRGLWSGSSPNVMRAALVNIGDLTTYDMSKHFIMKKTHLPDSTLLHFLASIAAGLAATVIGNPADVVKSRIMNQPTDEHGRGLYYKGPIDCIAKTIKNEGVLALYKGFFPLWIRLGPWALIFWVSFEKIRISLGGPGY